MKVEYKKQPKTFEEQISLLQSRGLIVPNKDKAVKVLKNISYSRLSAYWYPLLKGPKDKELFKEGVEFDTIFHIYQFDSELRLLVFYAIEQIEIAFRTQLIYHLSHKYNSGFWYENSAPFNNLPKFVSLLNKVCTAIKETKQEFILKYNRKYIQYLPPAWKSFEIVSFRTLYSTFKNLSDKKDQAKISQHFGLHHTVFISWMDCLVYIRNICAHHSRLWNIKLTISPVWPKSPRHLWVDRWENEIINESTKDKQLKVYATLCIIVYFMDFVNPYHRFRKELKKLILKYSEIDIAHMGFPENWEQQDLWQ